MIEIRTITDGKLIARLTGHTALVTATAFAPDGKTLATADESGVIKFWNVATWQEYANLRLGSY
ncbi:MAG: WD40 repeat domain-containing protein [Acidobacteriota bacterium]